MNEDIEADPTSPKLVICAICRLDGRFVSMKFNPKAGSFDKRVQAHLKTHTDAGALTDKQLKKRKENEQAAERRHQIQTEQSARAQSKQAAPSPVKKTRPLMQWLTPEKQQRLSTDSGQDADGPDDDGEVGGTLSHL
jgi:thiamine pyrophosphate-dependent acetolactate synthase large subunit-like protein